MNGRNDVSQTIQLTASEVAMITRSMALDIGEASPVEPTRAAPAFHPADGSSHSIASFSFAALAFYMLIIFVQAILDVEHVNNAFQTQLFHYALTDFWLNISGAMLLATWTMVDREQPYLAGGLSRS